MRPTKLPHALTACNLRLRSRVDGVEVGAPRWIHASCARQPIAAAALDGWEIGLEGHPAVVPELGFLGFLAFLAFLATYEHRTRELDWPGVKQPILDPIAHRSRPGRLVGYTVEIHVAVNTSSNLDARRQQGAEAE